MENIFDRLFVVGMATVYFVFVFTAKNGPASVFKRIRLWLAERNIPFVSKHLLCPTCCALSSGVLFWVLYGYAPWLVAIFAVGGVTLIGHGLAGYWHVKDDD